MKSNESLDVFDYRPSVEKDECPCPFKNKSGAKLTSSCYDKYGELKCICKNLYDVTGNIRCYKSNGSLNCNFFRKD